MSVKLVFCQSFRFSAYSIKNVDANAMQIMQCVQFMRLAKNGYVSVRLKLNFDLLPKIIPGQYQILENLEKSLKFSK